MSGGMYRFSGIPVLRCQYFYWTLVICFIYETCYCLEQPSYTYQRSADVHFGVLMGMHYSHTSGECSQAVRRNAFYDIQVIKMTVDEINKNSQILPNVTLGFGVKDTCLNREKALKHAVAGLRPLWSTGEGRIDSEKSKPVFAVLGCEISNSAIAVSGYLQIKQIPLLSVNAMADVLANKHLHPYFARLVPSGRHFGEQVGQLIVKFGWHYFALVYDDETSTSDIVSGFDNIVRNHNACYPIRQIVHKSATKVDIRKVVLDTTTRLRYGNIIILILSPEKTNSFLNEIIAMGKQNRYIFVLANPLEKVNLKLQETQFSVTENGALIFDLFNHHSKWFNRFKELSYDDVKDTPWAKDFVKSTFQCRWWHRSPHDNLKQSRSCRKIQKVPFSNSHLVGGRPIVRDPRDFKIEAGVRILAKTLHDTIMKRCPEYFETKNSTLISRCLRGKDLFSQLTTSEFRVKDSNNKVVNIHFHADGDISSGATTINQAWGHSLFEIGVFHRDSSQLVLHNRMLRWPLQLAMHPDQNSIPVSQCSLNCPAGSKRVFDGPCCWRCSQCNPNAVVAMDDRSCRPCPALTWPNASHRRSCHILTSIQSSAMGIWIISSIVGGVNVSLIICIFILLMCRRHTKLVKSSQLPLYLTLLFGVLLLSLQSYLFLITPSTIICVFRQLLFPLNLTFVASILLVRSLRILAILRTSSDRPIGLDRSCTGPRSQVGLIVSLVSAQLAVSLFVVWTFSSPRAKLIMPDRMQPVVDLVCEVSVVAIHLPASYSAFLAFLTVGLAWPARLSIVNCREAARLLISAIGTLFLWAIYFPLSHFLIGHCHRSHLHLLLLHVASVLYMTCLFLPMSRTVMYGCDAIVVDTCSNSLQLMSRDEGTIETRDDETVINGSQA